MLAVATLELKELKELKACFAELEESEVLGPDEHRFDAELLLNAVWAAGRWGESEV